MPSIAESVRLRPLRDADVEAIAEIARANFPDTPRSAREVRDQYRRFDASRFARAWVVAEDAAGRIVGYGFYSHVPWAFHPDKYQVYAAVHPEVQRQGVGTRLMRALLDRLGDRGATRLTSWAREDHAHAIAFLRRFGFEERGRTVEWRLPVASVDPQRFAGYAARARQAGVEITTLAEELRRNPACLPAVYQAHCALDISAPREDPDLPTPVTYDDFLRDGVRHPQALLDGYFLGKMGDVYVGESALKRGDADPGVLWQQLTAVLPAYRGHGIATALKLRTIDYAQRHGYREIRTFNSSRNGPMLAINGKLGFVRQPAWVDVIRAEPA